MSYSWTLLLGIVVSFLLWHRVVQRDRRLLWIYLAALLGAFVGAKLAYLLAEGFLHFNSPDRWRHWATGKSVLGALLGGYAAVELAKRSLGYQRATGDLFAASIPAGIALGRVGCGSVGCCLGQACPPTWYSLVDAQGVHRWPAVPVEILFNSVMIGVFWMFRRLGRFPGQHFHLYLIAYGAFRFLHEMLRETPRLIGAISGYQILSMTLIVLGVVGFELRRGEVTNPCLGWSSGPDKETCRQ